MIVSCERKTRAEIRDENRGLRIGEEVVRIVRPRKGVNLGKVTNYAFSYRCIITPIIVQIIILTGKKDTGS